MSRVRAEVEKKLAQLIEGGYCEADLALVRLEDEISRVKAPPVWRTHLGKLARELENRQREREESWLDYTVNDCIDGAFGELDGGLIVAEQNAGFSEREGWEIVRKEINRGARQQLGAVFFHGQDLERGLAGEGLMLSYGSFETDNPEADEAVGREVCAVLGRHGVEVDWNGQADTRLRIPPFTWRRRRFTDAPGHDLIVHSCTLEHRVAVLKVCKKVLGMSLADARAGLNTLEPASWRWDRPQPWVVLRRLPWDRACQFADALKEAGAEVSIR